MGFHRWDLDNGLSVVGERHPQMKSVSVGFFVKTGSRDEPPALNGVSHFLEHMLFKGSATLSGEEIDATFDRLGAEYNAFTGGEYTGYYARVLPEHLVALFELLVELMQPALRLEDFELEKNVILEEIALYEDRPAAVLQRKAIATFYAEHPLGQDILGSTASVTALTQQQMDGYYKERYVPHNITLAFVGNFNPEQVQSLVQRHCKAWRGGQTERVYPAFVPRKHHDRCVRDHLNREHGVVLCPAPAYQSEQREAMDLLVDVLGHPGNSRLHWALVDKGLVDYAAASYHAQDGLGVAGVSYSCDPDATVVVTQTIQHEVETLVKRGVSQPELNSARNRVLTSLAVEGEQSLRRLFSFSFDFLYDLSYRDLDLVLARFQHVSVEAVARLLGEFSFRPQTFVRLVPGHNEQKD